MRTLSEVEQQIEMEMGLGQVPGLAAAIVRGERIVWSRGFGVTTVADGTSPVTPSTPFRIGSVTKPLTSMAIMRLVEAHALTLDEPVKAYVPWFRLSEVGAADRVTLRMLLCHTAGLPSGNGTGNRNQRALEAYVREEPALCRGVGPPGKV